MRSPVKRRERDPKRPKHYIISEHIVGWGALSGAVIEVAAPTLLAIDLLAAGGLASFGFLLVTGRADAAVKRVNKAIQVLSE